jgi:hypothetical protein
MILRALLFKLCIWVFLEPFYMFLDTLDLQNEAQKVNFWWSMILKNK